MPNKEGKETEEVTGPPDQFVGRDLLESYVYYRNYMPSNPIEAYNIKRKCIEFGKELLPSFIDPEEKDEEQIKKNQKEQEKTDALYALACTTLKKEILDKRKIKFDHLIKDHRVYKMSAEDANDCEAVKEELETVLNNFTNQQHEQHMEMLVEVDNKIFHVLSMTGIIPAINPTFDNLKSEMKKQFLSEIMEQPDEKYAITVKEEEDAI